MGPGELEVLLAGEGVRLRDGSSGSYLDELHERPQQLFHPLVPLSPAVPVPELTSSGQEQHCSRLSLQVAAHRQPRGGGG